MAFPTHPRVKKLRRQKAWRWAIGVILIVMVSTSIWYSQNTFGSSSSKTYVLTIDAAEFSLQCEEVTVGECLHKDAVAVFERDYLSPTMTTPMEAGMHVIIRRAIPVQFVDVVGEKQRIYSHGTRVADVLAEMNIVLGTNKRVTPDANSWLESDMEIRILAEREEKYTKTVTIPFEKEQKKDVALTIGKQVIEQKGENGKKEETYRLIYIGDELKEKKLLKTEILTEPRTEIVRVGTKLPDHTETIAEGKASFYSASLDGSLTATGKTINLKELVAAHKTLPFGSVVKVTNVTNGKSVIVRIVDRGPYIAGRVIDLTPAAFAEIAPLSSGVVNVRLDLIVD